VNWDCSLSPQRQLLSIALVSSKYSLTANEGKVLKKAWKSALGRIGDKFLTDSINREQDPRHTENRNPIAIGGICRRQ